MIASTIDLIYNLALLAALSVISGFIREGRWSKGWENVLQGLLFGGASVIGMMHPLVLGPGLIFDGRSIMIGICGLFFGPVAVGLAASLAALYRYQLGGLGTTLGECVIAASALLSLVFHYRWPRAAAPRSPWMMLGLGLAVHVAMVLLMFTLPAGMGLEVFYRIGGPILLTYPLVTLLIGQMLSNHETGLQSWEALRQREQQFRSYVENAPIGVFICNEQGRYLRVNPAAVAITGFDRRELLTMAIPDLLPAEALDLATLHFQMLQEAGRATGEMPFRHKDGHLGHWSVDAVRLSSTRFLGFVTDLTERKQAEGRQTRLQAQLQQAQKLESLGGLAGGLAHDMNNVLGAILGLASTQMESQPVASPAHRAFATIAQAATRGGIMVKGLLSFARQSPAETQRLDLNAILLDEVHLLEHSTLAKVRLELDFDGQLKPIRGDAGALGHAFMNLWVNAVDAMPLNGTLTLRTRNLDLRWVEIQVEDTGSGMAKEVLERAMDPFFTTKEVGKGTGLGLAMVYNTVKAHQGHMEIRSEPGQGTCVTIRLPALTDLPVAQEPAARPNEGAMGGGLRVLLVDDDDLIQTTLRMMLEAMGHQGISASCGEEALLKLEEGLQPDMVILDLNMPGLGGSATLAQLRILRPTLPVLLATGRADQTAVTLAESFPLVTLMPKPFGIQELRKHLEA